jgi:hypothetical protein
VGTPEDYVQFQFLVTSELIREAKDGKLRGYNILYMLTARDGKQNCKVH